MISLYKKRRFERGSSFSSRKRLHVFFPPILFALEVISAPYKKETDSAAVAAADVGAGDA